MMLSNMQKSNQQRSNGNYNNLIRVLLEPCIFLFILFFYPNDLTSRRNLSLSFSLFSCITFALLHAFGFKTTIKGYIYLKLSYVYFTAYFGLTVDTILLQNKYSRTTNIQFQSRSREEDTSSFFF